MSGKALVVSRDGKLRKEWAGVCASRGLVPVAAESPGRAEWLIGEHAFVLAVIQWTAADSSPTSDSLHFITGLHKNHPGLLVLICTADQAMVAKIQDANPAAFIHDPTVPTSLCCRLDALVGRWVGDLRIHDGKIFHRNGTSFRHPVALKLLMAYPRPARLAVSSSNRVAIHRFRQFLVGQDSVVQVRSLSTDCDYVVVVSQPQEAVA